MAQSTEDIAWLYGKLKAKGYDIGTQAEFTASLANERDRQWYYNKAKGMGLNMGTMDDFNNLYAPASTPAQQQATQPAQAQPAAAAPATASTDTATAEAATPATPQQPAWQPTEQDKIRMSWQMHQMNQQFQQNTQAIMDKAKRVSERNTPEGRRKLKAAEWSARAAGLDTRLMGLTPPTQIPQGESADGQTTQDAQPQPLPTQSPVPYGVKIENGKQVIEWLMPDGSLTTNLIEADKGEYMARQGRLQHQFVNRMKANGLDPAKPQDIETQANYDAQAPAYRHVAALWSEAEEAQRREVERINDQEWSSYNAMGGGHEMRIVTTSAVRHRTAVSHFTKFDLEKMMDNTWARLGEIGQQQMIADCYNRLKQYNSGASDAELHTAATEMARSLTDNAVYQYAVSKNAPKSATEFFLRKVGDANILINLERAMARSHAGTSGDLAAYEAANAQFGKAHKFADVSGTVVGMATDPVTWVSGGVGSLGGKYATWLGGRLFFNKAGQAVANRAFASTLAGRITAGVGGGIGMMGSYEGMKEMESQLVHGGHVQQKQPEGELLAGQFYNPYATENIGYSSWEALKATGHGAMLGAITGPVTPVVGNFATPLVRSATSTTGKVLLRTGELGTSTLLEGTIFAIPTYLESEGESWGDVWSDSMALMLGFKAQHGIKSAPRVIKELSVEGKRYGISFEERVRNNMDKAQNSMPILDKDGKPTGRYYDLSFTKDELAELRRGGYGRLADIFRYDKVDGVETGRAKYGEERVIETPIYETNGNQIGIERKVVQDVEGFDTTFDGYAAMERLMSDNNISEAARAKAYYILTGRNLPTSTIMGYTTHKNEQDGTVIVEAKSAQGSVITSRTFKNEKEAQNEIDAITRQMEFNTVEIGEQYKTTEANNRVMDTSFDEVAAEFGSTREAMRSIYQRAKQGDVEISEGERQVVARIDEAVERNKGIADADRPEAIRARIKEETGHDVDEILRKQPKDRTEAEQAVIDDYVAELYPERDYESEARYEAAQQEANAIHDASRLLYGRYEQADPDAQAEIDAIYLRYEEAHNDLADRLDEATFSEVQENPWAFLTDPDMAEHEDALLYYINSRTAYEGVMQAHAEGMENKRAAIVHNIESRIHKDNGMIIPATMKVEDRQVYIVKGDVQMFPDGTAVDVRNSSESVVICDAESGEFKMVSPDQIFKVGEPLDAQEQLNTALAALDAEPSPFDNMAGVDLTAPQAEGDTEFTPADTAAYDKGYEDGIEVVSHLDDTALNSAIEDLRGRESLTDEWRGRLEAYEYEQQRRAQEGVAPADKPADAVEQPLTPAEATAEEAPQGTALSRIPVEGDEPQFTKVDAVTGWDGLVEMMQGDEKGANEIVLAQIQQARDELEKLKKKPPTLKAPTLKGSPMAMAKARTDAQAKYDADLATYNNQLATLQADIDAWTRMSAVYNSRNAEARAAAEAERQAANAAAHDAAVARFEEEQRIKAEKEAEQAAIGTHAVNPKIKAKWDNAPKVEGHSDAITLPDGSTIRGRYILTEAGATSASHDVNNAYAPTEGFPIDENGQSVNDRDYQRDTDAQRIVEDMAVAFDNRALQSPIIVSKDGVVLSGNNRTMSGDLAAVQGTDKAYVDYLREFSHKYGFTPEQVGAMQHPRVVFVPDEAMAYDATTFARFNAQEMKSQSKPEAAVKLGKVVPEEVFNSIVADIARYDRLSDYYADERAVAQALGALQAAGVINDKQMPELRTGTQLSAAGKELLENTLIGKTFQSSPDAVRDIIATPTLRQSIVMGLSEIVANRTLAKSGYDLSAELAKAVDLVARAKNAMPDIYVEGVPVSPFGRMQGLFDDEFGDSRVTDGVALLLADALNSGKPSELRKFLLSYNSNATQSAAGQMDIFSGGVIPKEQILTEAINHFRNATPKEQQALVEKLIADRKQRADAERQRAGGQGLEQTPNGTDSSAEPARVEPTEAQKAAGNYKKKHVRVDGHEISIENEKGTVRRGKDADGKEWATEMHNDYGYIRGTKGVDGDHIDVYLSDTPEQGDVFVVDQYNPDGTFDEHKVMYGFPTEEAARSAYLSNYEEGWENGRRLDITHVSKEEFDKWIESSKRKTKPFAEYKSVKPATEEAPEKTAAQRAWHGTEAEMPATPGLSPLRRSVLFENAVEAYKEGKGEASTYTAIMDGKEFGYNEFEAIYRDNNQNTTYEKTLPFLPAVYEYLNNRFNAALKSTRPKVQDVLAMQKEAYQAEVSKEPKWLRKLTTNAHERISPEDGVTIGDLAKYIDEYRNGWQPPMKWEDFLAKVNRGEVSKEEAEEIVPKYARHFMLRDIADQLDMAKSAEEHKNDPQRIDDEWGDYSITPTTYTNKAGKTSDMFIVKIERNLTPAEQKAIDAFVKAPLAEGKKTSRGWFDRKQGGYMMRSEEAARQLGNLIDNPEAMADAQPLSRADIAKAAGTAPQAPDKQEAPRPANKVESLDELDKYWYTKGRTLSQSLKEAGLYQPLDEIQQGMPDFEVGKTYPAEGGGTLEVLSIRGAEVRVQYRPEGDPRGRRMCEACAAIARLVEKPKIDATEKGKLTITDSMKAEEDILRDLLGIDDDEVSDDVKFRDPGELTPEQKRKVYAAGVNYALGYFDQNITAFPDFAAAMVGRLGAKIKPWLKSFYEGAKRIPGYDESQFTPSEEVDKFDVANFDKPSADMIAAAEAKLAERKAEAASQEAEKSIIEQRNQQRKEEDDKTTAGTVALAEEAGAVASEAESLASSPKREPRPLLRSIKRIDDTLDKVNEQLALLGYYEADPNAPEHEVYGLRRSSEKKALADAVTLTKKLVADLGLEVDKVTSSTSQKPKKTIVRANMTGIGGDISISLPLAEGKELYINVSLEPTHERGVEPHRGGGAWEGDNLEVKGYYYRVESPDGSMNRHGHNNYGNADMTYNDLLHGIQRIAYEFLPERETTDTATYRSGDKVQYSADGGKSWTDGKVVEVDHKSGMIKIDAGMAPVLYVNAEPSQVRRPQSATPAPTDKPASATAKPTAEKAGVPKGIAKTPLIKQWEEMKKKRPDALCIFKVGDFYEIFGEDAQTASNVLGITLTRRANGKDSHIFLAGFPLHALDTYLPKLVRAGHRVALCEQLEDPKVKREIVPANGATPNPIVGAAVKSDNEMRVRREITGSLVDKVMADEGYKKAIERGDEQGAEVQAGDIVKKALVDMFNSDDDVLAKQIAGESLGDNFFPRFASDTHKRAMRQLKEGKTEPVPKKATPDNDIEALKKAMDDFYSPALIKEDAVEQMSHDDAVDLHIIDLLNPGMTDHSRNDIISNIEASLKFVSDDKLKELAEKWNTNADICARVEDEIARRQEALLKEFEAKAERGESPYTVTPEVEEELAEQKKQDEAKDAAVNLLKGGKKGGKSKKKSVTLQPDEPLGGLFGDTLDEQTPTTTNERTDLETGTGQAGRERQQREPNSPMGGNEPRRETQRPAGGTGSRGTGVDTHADRAGSRRVSSVAAPATLEPIAEGERKNTHNNFVERGTDTAPKSVDARIKANIDAIETLKRLQASGEPATPADMKKLRAFSGWGGLGKAFSDWTYRDRLRKLIGEKQFDEDAQMSRNSAYFTPAYVVDAMWDIARGLGFTGGRVLEGSAGVGNVLGLMPRELSERSVIHAVEKDPTTGGMLSLLYPDARVDVQGFEETKIANGSIDLAITNVPFIPHLRVNDKTGDSDLSKRFRDLHNFCIAKNVRKLRDGGIGIFITTSGTLDGKELYHWLTTDGNSDIVGLFRMHNETFGGTNATSDIIVVRKRVNGVKSEHALDASKNTGLRVADYHTGKFNKNGDPIIVQRSLGYNRYFIEHPEHMAGEMKFGFEVGDTYRPTSISLYPTKEKDQGEMLKAWVAEMQTKLFDEPERGEVGINHRELYTPTYDKVGNEVKTGTLIVNSQGQLCVNYDGVARPLMSALDKKNPKSEQERIAQFNRNKVKGRTRPQVLADYNAIKKALNDVLEYQKTNESDEGLQPLLDKLNRAFDNFVRTYGNLHGNNGIAWLRNDVDYPSILALETYKEVGINHDKVFGKSDIFSRRVVTRPEPPKATNVKDGVILSIRQTGALDTQYIADALGISEPEVRKQVIEAGLGFENPLTHGMEAAHTYLSGNVREKLKQAEENNEDGKYSPNITALRKVVPHDIPSHFIEFSIGSSWISPSIFEEYVKEKTGAKVTLTYAVGSWTMKAPKEYQWSEQDMAFGIKSDLIKKTVPGHELIYAAMTNRTIKVSRQQKDGEVITDPKATSACAAKVDEIRDDFKSWMRQRMQDNPEFAREIESTYNSIFNNSAPITIPAEYIPEYFDGAARVIGGKDIKMREHQAKAVVRGTMQSLMLAHEVGTGKTFTLITTAMEMRRLGTAKKPMIVVQNATIGQFVASAKALYPDARILSLEDNDRTAQGRKDFYAKIRYNDWDIVVIPQSVLEKIPDHPDRERQFIEDTIQEKMDVIESMAGDRDKSQLVSNLQKEVEKMRDRLAELQQSAPEEVTATKGKKKDEKKAAVARENARTRAEELLDRATDDTLNFDDLGVDAILVDEAHEYKHLGFATAMQRGIKGIDPSYSKKCQGLFLKVKAVQEMSGGRNVIFATGTPISNTAAEIWTFMRYLLPRETMEAYNIWHFDDFVRNFGSIQQLPEFTAAGAYKEVNRFAGYNNLPELARIWAGIADTVLTAEAGEVKSQIPELEGGKPTDIYLPQTSGLRAVLKFVKAQLKAFEEMSGQEKKENSHIPLTMYGIAKAAAIDARLVMANAPDDPHSKTNEAVRQTLKALEDSKAYNGTVAIFADNYQRKNRSTGFVEFNLFEDIAEKLIKGGVPAEQIVIMRDGLTDKRKEKIFAQVNAGEIRVILGTTQRLGVGVNIQERLHTLMHIDAPNRPMDYWQRMGRLLRQGNMHKDMGIPVRVIRFGVEDSLDVTAYQRLKTKGAIADAVMNSKQLLANNLENRVLEEEGDEFGNITAELSGSEYAILQNQAEKELRKLLAKQDQHRQHQMHIHRTEPRLRAWIEQEKERIASTAEALEKVTKAGTDLVVKGKTYNDEEKLEELFKASNKSIAERRVKAEAGETSNSSLKFTVGGIEYEWQTVVSPEVDFAGDARIMTSQVRGVLLCPELWEGELIMNAANLKRIIGFISEEIASGKQFREEHERATNAKERYETDLASLLKDKGKEFEHGDRIAELKVKLEEYSEKLQADLAAKEAKYAEMDAQTAEADDIVFTREDDEDEEDGKKESNGDGNKYRLVEDAATLDFLDNQPMKLGYRYSQWANMGVLPPMTAKKDGQWRAPMIFSRWEQSEEGMMKDNGKADLVQGNGRTTGDVAYNPYFHIRTSPLNDQFTAAYDRPELLVVEGYYPESEETSGYHAKGAKDSVGLMDWHSGSVNAQLSDETKVQTMLSRYFKPTRIKPWSEVADLIMERVGEQNVVFPINQFPPMLRAELAKRGAKFGEPMGQVAEKDIPMLLDLMERVNAGEWDAGLEKARAYFDAYNSSAEAKEARVAEISTSLNVPVRVIAEQSDIDALPSKRQQNAKGWFDSRTGEVVVVLPNNVNVADVDNTMVHEVVGHYGLELLVGKENMPRFMEEIYDHAGASVKKGIDAIEQKLYDKEVDRLTREKGGSLGAAAEAYAEANQRRRAGDFRREATEEYTADLGGRVGHEGFKKMSEEELTFWGKIKAKIQSFLDKFMAKLKIPKSIRLTDKDLQYILFRSWKNLKERGVFAEAEDITMRRRTGYDADAQVRFRDPDMGLEETITRMKAEAMQANADNLQAKRDAMRAIGGNLNHLRQAMARQREYDIATAKSIKDLATILMDKGLLDGFARHEVEGILVAMNNAIGRQDISKQVDRVFDIMVRNQLRAASGAFGKLTSIRGSRVDARGIEVQGQLDVNGQKMVKALNDAKRLDEDTILERIADATDRMSDSSQTIADNASIEYVGLKFALEYVQNITKSKIEEDEMRKALKTAEEDKNAGRMSKDAYKQLVAATEESIRRNKLDRAEAYFNLIGKLTESMQGSIESAKAFREAEKERIGSIHHFANSDLQGLPAYTTGRRNKKGHTKKSDKVVNALASTILAPLGTFEQYCRLIGSKSVDGRGYIYEHFVVGMQECRDKEWEDRERVEGSLNDKAASILGKKKAKWIDLKALTRKHAGVVEWMDGGEMRNHLITQGNIMAIYMWNKQDDGRVKLRAMGITEEDVEYAVEALDPKLKEVADWIQDEFLVDFRDEINPTYERVNGASMDAIENYFPIKTLANAREEKEDMSNYVDNEGLPKTMTGSLIKRKFNVCALDIMNSDPIDIVIDHVRENIEWKNMVELRRDLGTLLSYKLFRNRMKNMSTIYGAGERNWKHFKKCAMLVGGAYKPHTGDFDKAMVNMTKLATGACIALNFNSAIKQLLSYPAFAKDASVLRLLYNATPHRARMCWNWAMDNMPAFRRRWNSRQGGNDILRDWDGDWDWTKSEFIQKLQRAGLSPNAFVDALTISMGSEAVYHSSYKRYMRDGFSKEVSHQRAILDAEIIFNLSQQSSELSYLSLLQNDRSYITMSFTNFRNSSMSYTRQQVQAARELYNLTMHREEQLEFETKKAMREGLSEEQARTRAKRKYNRQWAKAISGLGIFAVILPALWKFGLQGAWYSIFGDDDEKKKEYAENALKRGAEFGWMEGLAGGGTVPDLLYSMFQGEEFSFDEETSPATASFADMINAFGRGNKYKGINDGVNFAISIGVGVRPQYVEDVIAAGLDFFEADEKAMRDYQMLMLRLISVPQSQLDDMYFDELGLTGTEAKRMSPAQLAGRYSLYKVRRGNLPTMWMMSDEEIEKAKKPYVDKFNREVKSRLDRLNSDETRALVAEYDATHEKFKAIDKKWDDGRTEEAQREQDELMSTTDMDRYWRVDWYKSEISRLTKELLKTSDKTQADSIVNLMRMEQSRLLEEVGTNAAQ